MSKQKNVDETFAKNLKMLMKEKAVTLRKAAEIAGVSQATISDWQTGTSPTNHRAVLKLSRFLGVSLTWLLTGETDSGEGKPRFEDVIQEGAIIFDGIAKIQIQHLVIKGKAK